MQAFQANAERLKGSDTQVLGMSIDTPFANKKFATEINVDFPLLSDMNGSTLKSYDLAKDYTIKGVKTLAARRANILIDKDGKIAFIQLDNDAVDPTKSVDACERKKLKE